MYGIDYTIHYHRCLITKSERSVECRGRRHIDDDDVDDDNKALKTIFPYSY